MTGAAPPTEWYLARDNKQHGPLSDLELMKLVEFRHLRPHDLVWRAGLADWMPAPVVFPQAFLAAEPEPLPPAMTAEVRHVEASHVEASPVEASPVDAERVVEERPAEPQAVVSIPSVALSPMIAGPDRQNMPAPQPALRAQPAASPFRPAGDPPPAGKIETLSDYRARLGSRLDAAATAAPTEAANGDFGFEQHQAEAARHGAPDRSRAAPRRMWIAPADGEAQAQAVPQPNEFDPDPQRYRPRLDIGGAAPGPLQAQATGPSERAQFGSSGRVVPARFEPSMPGPRLDGLSGNRQLSAQRSARPSDQDEDSDDLEPSPPRKRGLWGLIAILMLLALMAGGTWVALMHPQLVAQSLKLIGLDAGPGDTSASTAVAATGSSSASRQAAVAAKAQPAAAMSNFPENAAAIDEMLQAGHLWQVVRAEFPEWYDERVKEASRLVADKKPDEAVTKHFVDALVALRRKTGDSAFQSSLPRLELVARRFRDNLELLGRHSQVACYSLISTGEGSRGMINLFRDPDYSPGLQSGLAAVFEAIAEGRRTPNTNLAPRRADYDVLTKELTALGWKEQDLNLFADSQALQRSTPEQVCRMVREWFTAHLSVKDKDVQLRLLIESVRPVVAG